MLQRFFLATLPLLIALPGITHAAKVVVITGDQSAYGRRIFSGYSSLANETLSAFQYETKNDAALINKIKTLAPDLVFTIGEVPLPQLVALLPSTPFVVGNYHAQAVASKANVVLLESTMPIGAGLPLVKLLLPKMKRVGTIYDPKHSARKFKRLEEVAKSLAFTLPALKVDSPADVNPFVHAFTGQVDLLYWMRDSTTSNETTLDEIYEFARKSKLPTVTTDPSQMDQGALMAVALDPFRLGESAWLTTEVILKEGKIPQMPVEVEASQLVVWISLSQVKEQGIEATAFQAFLEETLRQGYNLRLEP